jgi:predicted transcriptional regulator
MGNRSRTEIVSSILDAANGAGEGATKTKIIYKALKLCKVKEYLSVLIENNLIESLNGIRIYKITEKGLNYLKMNNEIGDLLLSTIKITN